MFRKVLAATILLALVYFVGGSLAVKAGYLSAALYDRHLSWVGGMASVCGLITFILPRMNASDIEGIEIDALDRMTKAVAALAEKTSKLSTAEAEIDRLERQRQEMDLLVRKAAMQLFLESRVRLTRERILQIINGSPELLELLRELRETEERAVAAGAAIEADPHADVLAEILGAAQSDLRGFDAMSDPLRTFARAMEEALRIMAKLTFRQ